MISMGRQSPFTRAARIFLHSSIGVILIALFLHQIDIKGVTAQLARATLLPVLIGLIAYALDFLLRAIRFCMLLETVTGRRLEWQRVPGPFIASFGINDLLPLRAGDAFRLLWFRQRMGFRTSDVFGAMIIERIYDLFSLLMLGFATLAWRFQSTALLLLMLSLLSCALLVPLIVKAIQKIERARRVTESRSAGVRRIVDGLLATIGTFSILRSPRLSFGLLVMSLLCWLLEAAVLYGAWISLGGAWDSWAEPVAAFAASTLGTLVPGLPGHFGTFEVLGLETFQRSGVAQDFGAAVLVFAHILLWAPTALFAVIWLTFTQWGNPSGKATEQSDGLLPQG